MHRITVSGRPSSPATTFLLGTAVGTAIAYVGARTVFQEPPRPEHGYHHGTDLAATSVALFRFVRDLL